MTIFKDYCIRILSKVRPQATFLTINGYKNNWGEVSNFSVVFHVNYLNAVKKAQNIVKKAKYNNNPLFSPYDLKIAKGELLDSFSMTLDGFNPLYTCHGIYEPVLDAHGKPLLGAKLHKRLDALHLNALQIRKKIIKAVDYDERDSAPKTIAKNFLKKQTSLGKWVQFKLIPRRFDELIVQKMKIKG